AKDGGFAIVFETKKLEPLLNREAEERNYFPLGWGDVIYHGDEKKLRKELGDQVNIIKDLLMRLAQARAFKTEVPVPELIETVAYAVCIALYKHIGFAEENEVRIYAYRPCDRVYKLSKAVGAVQPQAEIHKNKHGKPYIELFRNFREPLPIKRIIVGPQRNKEKVAQELRKDSRLRDIVSVSGIPYIEQSWGEDN
ncbi:MAG TPA: DUF2971 domain-containing protein, partial [Verrucomicrobiae bacterium]|nr:DUF2971 domain-containing protein [Verrucomicrobiae bacterium]